LTLAVAIWLAAGALPAQVVRLPPVDPPSQMPVAGRLVDHRDSSVELAQLPRQPDLPERTDALGVPRPDSPQRWNSLDTPLAGLQVRRDTLGAPRQLGSPAPWEILDAPPPEPDRPADARPGVFQKLIFNSTWLAPSREPDELGATELELKTVLAFPVPSRESPLIVTPGFAVNYLDGPAIADLPSRVYEAYAQFRWRHRLRPRLGLDLALTPGVYSDFRQGSDEAVRIAGHGAGMFTWNPRLKLVLGVAYLDREDVGVIPLGGVIWTPDPDTKLELVAPRPRVARRIYSSGACGEEVQDWVYLGGEFGGGSWAVRRLGGANDVATYRDYRLILGLERKAIGGLDYRLELGYLFGRRLEYNSGTPDVRPPDGLMLRAGVTY